MTVFINKLTLTGEAQELEKSYAHVAEHMETQPGLIRYLLVRSTKDPDVYYNVAEWESEELFRASVSDSIFRERLGHVTKVMTGEPHLTEVVLHGQGLSAVRPD
ncbi:antibiotic biosynthesis monooxygenase family protein [Rhodococcoides kyotonense]|uniref:Heme-degrading monooxygenase HmoA n=1 Tax=Rhodococcoides kyotonense TaxID=398843 RepID=A0A239MCK9_9NOCA|nr:antibiotic biosynthesis monooxygenase family protein [Rhodococcus kyotonensis]SNT39774.1 Heme-degrading monooxygenase HmoA [Rhodococcus kyotonensis]